MVDKRVSCAQMERNSHKQFLSAIGGSTFVVIYRHNFIQSMHDYINVLKLIQQDHIE